jgi:hypothetical protein
MRHVKRHFQVWNLAFVFICKRIQGLLVGERGLQEAGLSTKSQLIVSYV